jgi:HK97 family phage major capsid protein
MNAPIRTDNAVDDIALEDFGDPLAADLLQMFGNPIANPQLAFQRVMDVVDEAIDGRSSKRNQDDFLAGAALAAAVIHDQTTGASEPAPAKVKETPAQVLARLKLAGSPVRFATFGEQVHAAIRGASGEGVFDNRLVAANSEYGGAEGGFLVQPEFAAALMRSAIEETVLARLCDRRRNGRGRAGLTLPMIDETSRADGSRLGGVRAYWLREGQAIDVSRPRYAELNLTPQKLAVAVWATEELFADAVGFEDHLQAVIRSELAYVVDQAIIAGTGAGEPLGFLNGPATIAVAKESGQSAGTIVAQNVRKMWKTLPVASRRRAVWIANEDAETAVEEALGGTAAYQPAGTNGSVYPLVYGRPLIALEQAPPLGQPGDLSVVDLSQYILLDLGIRAAASFHVRFVEDEVLVRLIWRGDGAPAWRSPVASANGSGNRSPFVTLQART